MTSKIAHVRLPSELDREIEVLVTKGIYKTKSEFIVDATRRLLESSFPPSRVVDIMEKYKRGKIRKTGSFKDFRPKLRRMGAAIRRRYKTVEEAMHDLRGG